MTPHTAHTQARRILAVANRSGDPAQRAFAMRVLSRRWAALQRAQQASGN